MRLTQRRFRSPPPTRSPSQNGWRNRREVGSRVDCGDYITRQGEPRRARSIVWRENFVQPDSFPLSLEGEPSVCAPAGRRNRLGITENLDVFLRYGDAARRKPQRDGPAWSLSSRHKAATLRPRPKKRLP